MQVIIVLIVLCLCSCTQPIVNDDENDIYHCYLTKDGKNIICAEKIKPTKVARD